MTPAPRVLHIITSLAAGGAQRHLLDLLPGLGGPDRLDLIYFRDDDLREALRPLVGSIRRLPMAGPAGVLRLPALVAAVRAGGYDLVHTHLLRADIYGALAARPAGVRGVVSTKHNVERRLDRPWWRALHHLTARPVARTICISAAVQTWAVQAGTPAQRTRVIRYGLDPAPFQCTDRGQARRALGLGPEQSVVLCPARLDPQKNHAVLLRAIAGIEAALPDVRLLLAGGRQLGSAAYVAGLKRLSVELGLAKRVEWLGVRDDMPRLLAAADVVALASDWEGLGLVLLEAMAAHRPVVATRVGGVPEVVADGATGLLVPPGSVSAFAGALRDLLRDPTRARAMGEAGSRRLAEHFGPERMHRETRALYAEVLAKRAVYATAGP
jgi:glycosyltransferase involved in cell wall biosynthesis